MGGTANRGGTLPYNLSEVPPSLEVGEIRVSLAKVRVEVGGTLVVVPHLSSGLVQFSSLFVSYLTSVMAEAARFDAPRAWTSPDEP